MKLKVTDEQIRIAIKPLSFSLDDVTSIVPRLQVGQFSGCAINIIQGKTLIVTNGILLVYNNLNDFLAGLEPLSLVKDASICYDSEPGEIELYIMPEVENDVENPDFAPVRELMFGAREQNNEELENSNSDIDTNSQS